MTNHDYYTGEEKIEESWFTINIVDGGLALCKVCGCLEGGLASDCPGEKVSSDLQDKIYRGEVDYVSGRGWVKELNPTNVSWLFGKYIRFYGTDEDFYKFNDLSKDYFSLIKLRWIQEGYNLSKI